MNRMAAAAACALAGCTFGDEPERANDVVGDWFDDNCVPVECLFECCQGWNYSQTPLFHGGSVYEPTCEKARIKTSAYAEYWALMGELWNSCSSDFNDFETGYCAVVKPADVIEGFRPDGQPVYAHLSFSVCPPRGQRAAHPLEDVKLIPQE
jgi:hypothetical protein